MYQKNLKQNFKQQQQHHEFPQQNKNPKDVNTNLLVPRSPQKSGTLFIGGNINNNVPTIANSNKYPYCSYHQQNAKFNSDPVIQMEHSYSRDCRPVEGIAGLSTRTLMVHRVPQCPQCHAHPDEGADSDEVNNPPIPPYNEDAAKESMDECMKIAQSCVTHPDDEDWEERVNKENWTQSQHNLFDKIVKILDLDNLARNATVNRPQEPIHKRAIIDKSVERFRKIFAIISWDNKLTQWLHGLLMDQLSPTYMGIYMDILQTLKTKLPTLMDKVLFGKPMNVNQELLTPVLKKHWEPIITPKQRKLSSNALILIVPSIYSITNNGMPSRIQKWCQLFATIAPIVQVQIPNSNLLIIRPFDQSCEHLVHLTRLKIQELRREQPGVHIILVGINSSSALALQIGVTENINSIVCMGFSYNTRNGVRGAPDDQILEITTPILFVIGQNSPRTSQEEMESLREKLQSQTSLIVVGSADHQLRIPKFKRHIEGVTQAMVDSMIMDEIYEFIKNCIVNPPGPRQVNTISSLPLQISLSQARKMCGMPPITGLPISSTAANNLYSRKRKGSGSDNELPLKLKYAKNTGLIGRPRTRPLPNTKLPSSATSKLHNLSAQAAANNSLNLAIQSILPEGSNSSSIIDENDDESHISAAFEILTQSPPKNEIRSNQHQQLQQQSQLITNSTSSGTSGIINLQNFQQQPRQQFSSLSRQSTPTQKIKMIPSNQFIQMKPPSQQNAQRIYTIKTSPMLSGNGSSQSQVITVKNSGKSPLTTCNPSNTNTIILNSPPKFTLYKTPTGVNVFNSSTNQTNISGGNSSTSEISSTSILDLPILFADSDGNYHETNSIPSSSTPSSGGAATTADAATVNTATASVKSLSLPPPTFIINKNQSTSNASILSQSSSGKLILNTSLQNKIKPSKVVYINRNTMKPFTNIIQSKSAPSLKYANTKLIVTPNTKASSTPCIVPKASSQRDLQKSGIATITIQTPSTTVGGNLIKSGTGTILGSSTNLSTTKQYQPILFNVDSDKNKMKNMIKINSNSVNSGGINGGSSNTTVNNSGKFIVAGGSNVNRSGGAGQPISKPTILLKQGGLKTFPMSLKPGILNRNLTVRKINIIPAKPGTTLSQITTGNIAGSTNEVSTMASVSVTEDMPNSPSSIVTTVNSGSNNSSSKNDDSCQIETYTDITAVDEIASTSKSDNAELDKDISSELITTDASDEKQKENNESSINDESSQ